MAAAHDTTAHTANLKTAGKEDLDPSLRDAAQRYLHALFAATPESPTVRLPGENDDIRANIQQRLKDIPTLDPNTVGGTGCVTVLLIVITVAISNFKSLPLTVGVGLVSTIIITVLISIEIWCRRQHYNTKRRITDAIFPLALQQVAQNRTERAYLAAVQEVMPSNAEVYLTPEMRTEQMHGLNTLLVNGRRLEKVRADIAIALKDSNPEVLQEEAAALRHRIGCTTDEATRHVLQRSLALCEERLVHSRSLYGLLERLDAENELVYQAFGAAQSALATLRITPTSTDLYPADETIRVTEVAETIAQQTRSVEAAVQELGIRRM